jgi:RNA polymerase sigma-70 factor (ECF subfamily)
MNEALKFMNNEKGSSNEKRALQVEALFQEHHQHLLNSIMAKGLVKTEAEDVVQEAYIKLLGIEDGKIDNYIKAYLYRIAINLAIDKLRRSARSPVQLGGEPVELNNEITSLERNQQNKQLLENIAESIKTLPLKCRQAFILYKVKGVSYAEIAEIMQVSESMIRKHVLTAVRHCYQNVMKD